MTVLVPINEDSPERIGARINDLVHRPGAKEYLKSRYARGVWRRHRGSVEKSQDAMIRTAAAHKAGKMSAYVIMYGLDVVGMATALPGLRISVKRPVDMIKVLGKSSERLGSVPLRLTGSNVNAWVFGPNQTLTEEYTAAAYRELVAKVLEDPDTIGQPERVWSIEPENSAAYIHHAIQRAGLSPTGPTERYDVGEGGLMAPPNSQLYKL